MDITQEKRSEIKTLLEDMIKGIVAKSFMDDDLSVVTSFEPEYVNYREQQRLMIWDFFPEELTEEEKEKLYVELLAEILNESIVKLLQGE